MIGLLLAALCVIGIVYLFQVCRKIHERRKVLNKLPGPDGIPVLGIPLELALVPRNKFLSVIINQFKTYGPLFRTHIASESLVRIGDPEAAEIILTSRTNIEKEWEYKLMEPWLGTGLVTSTGAKWHTRRKQLTPAFHFSILDTFYETFVENGKILLDKLDNELESEGFDIFSYISKCTLDIICETAMGVKISAQEKPCEYSQAIKDIGGVFINRILRPWLWPDLIYSFTEDYRHQRKLLNVMHGMSLNVIRDKRQERQQKLKRSDSDVGDEDLGIKKRKPFLDLLLDLSDNSGAPLTDDDLREEVDTFMFAGHDTTSTALSWTIYLLGLHPDIQDKVVAEINDVLGSSSDDPPTMKELSELKYMDAVIKESFRVYPPVPMVGRKLSEDVTIGEYKIPAGTSVDVNIFTIHHNPKHYPNPEKFDPENFSMEKIKSRHPFAFIPFSAGPRNCIGQKFASLEQKLLLTMFLKKYKVVSLDKPEELSFFSELVLSSENGIRVKISKRK